MPPGELHLFRSCSKDLFPRHSAGFFFSRREKNFSFMDQEHLFENRVQTGGKAEVSNSGEAFPSGKGGDSSAPLASRMRPASLDEYVGQTHILGPGSLLRRSIEADRVQSLIFYGPPGTGKTTLAQIIAHSSKAKFERLSGVESNVADMRTVLRAAANRLGNKGLPTLLFIDEIHRFNKSQQDILLPDVENGTIKLIGATTHNPFFL